VIPGEVFTVDAEIELNGGKPTVTVEVENVGDRPIQVGSHYHFAATNPSLSFDRKAAWGYRLVAITGRRLVPGLRLESAGPLDGTDNDTDGRPSNG
jgi:urease beta subunit